MTDWKFRAAGVLGQGLVGGLFTTIRGQRIGYEPIRALRASGQNVLFVFWHGQLLPLVHYHRGEGVVVLVSEHDDGEYITRVLDRYGFETARGSSTRGGTRGLRGLLRAARAGHDLAITPDGPRGPARVFKPGSLVAAQLSGLPIVPVAVGVSAAWHFRSWDAFTVPKPLSRIRIAYGDPVWVPRDLPEEELEILGRTLQDTLDGLEDQARRGLGDGVYVKETHR
ncbi:MAG: lysophospholipid acyltransferase family protein [Gemmatimonadales bacterium]|nr:MAG: lysophospholipid acyltransferase family protein [Gemmatimonadales bacterium]